MNKTLLLCLLLACGTAQAQTYKCVDARGKVTYTSTPCEDAGQSGGEVRDRMNTSPTPAPVVPAPKTSTPPPPNRPEPAAGAAPAPAPRNAPERRCFTTKTGTRCNDDPGFEDPTPTDARSKGEIRAK